MLFIGKERAKELLDPNGGISSMRYVMVTTLELVVASVLVTLFILVYQAIFKDAINFKEAGYFIGGIAALFTGITGSKAYQSRKENSGKTS